MFTIRKEFSFSASHALDGLCDGHPCARVHGHNYVVTVEFRSEELDEAGMVKDYREMEPIKKFLDDAFDHKHLNDFLPFNPTAELMSRHLFEIFRVNFPALFAVEVSETPKTTARYGYR